MGNSSASARLAAAKRHLSSSAPVMAVNSGGADVGIKLNADTDHILYESAGSTRIYKLNRPKALNSLDWDMIASLAKQGEVWRQSELCKLVIGRGDERAFCAGGDVVGLVKLRPDYGAKYPLGFFKDEYQVNWEIARLGKPYVCIIDGFTMGGGAGISLPAQIRVATKKTVFAMPETKIGFAPDVGGNYYIAQLDGEIGAWLAMTGQEVWGRAVYELGLATHYVEPDAIPSLVEALSQLENPTLEQLNNIVTSYHVPAPEGAAVSSKGSREGPSPITGEIRAFLDKTFGLASIQEIYAALQAAQTDSALSQEIKDWAKAQKDIMDLRSPTGMAVALENFKVTRKAQNLKVALENDMLMSTGFCGTDRPTPEFDTGVSYLLIEKGRERANWQPSEINDPRLTPAEITKNYLDPNTPHLAETPKLVFEPAPTSEGTDSTWGKFRQWGLPAESEIRAVVKGESAGSGAFKLKPAEVVEQVLAARGEQGGPREKEIIAHTNAIIAARTKADGSGYLDWAGK
ncbi:hypothetical protein CcaverHIS631_0502340 [Cutaneotrichosporon cavernicola]|nr:hypothetical protein CcaverHIS631_0502340 [Cutaneotrichosporon cavernicola]